NGIQGMTEGDDGALLISMTGGIRRFMDGKTEVAYPYPVPATQLQAHKLLRDRQGGLWCGISGHGLLHVHQGRTDVFAPSDGLSGGDIQALFEDREGNIWVATTDGLDRFRDFAVVTFSLKQGLSGTRVVSVLADRDGSIWLSTNDGLNRWNNGQITTYDKR